MEKQTTTAAETNGTSNVSAGIEHLDQCVMMLQNAKTDTEKFSAFLIVTKRIKAELLDDISKKKLLDAIGIPFLGKMLCTNNAPDGCPKFMFKSIALTILTCFVSSCVEGSALYKFIPMLREIIAEPNDYEEDITVIKEAYQCLAAIASHKLGRKAIVDHHAIGALVDAYVDIGFYHEHALNLIRIIMVDRGRRTWDYEPDCFSKLMLYICEDFRLNQNEQKFYLCDVLIELLNSVPESVNIEGDLPWKQHLHKGISDILFSKLGRELRDKGLQLASCILENISVNWIVSESQKGQQLLLLMVHLACIEVRMSLEDKPFEQAAALAAQTTPCYIIIENAIKFLVGGALALEEKQKQQLYAALKGAFTAVLVFLKGASLENVMSTNSNAQMFTCASVRVLGAWLAEETSANKEEVYEILPFLINICKHNFRHNSEKAIVKCKKKSVKKNSVEKKEMLPDLLRFLLPGLCHLTAEDVPRGILIELEIEVLLFDYLSLHWKSALGTLLYRNDNNELYKNTEMIVTLCNIFMNIVVQEPSLIKKNYMYYRILKFIFSQISDIPNNGHHLQLSGSLCILGLMILRHHHSNVQRTDLSILRFIQATVRFLWDAYNVEESTDFATLVVSFMYEGIWDEVMELWYLGMHTLSVLLPAIPWLCDFLLESEWPQTIVCTLIMVKEDGICLGLKTAYEEFLCKLVMASQEAKEILIAKDIGTVCQNHMLKELSKYIKK